MSHILDVLPAEGVKACCAAFYESDWVRWLVGESFHPGGLALTERLGNLMNLQPHHQVLDVAAGRGASALFLAQRFGCQVVGVEYGHESVAVANAAAVEAGLTGQVRFEQGDAEQLPFADAAFDALICECAFCTFPHKRAAAAEFARVLRPNGRIGLSDLTRSGQLPATLDGLLAWISCIADARPVHGYATYLQEAGFDLDTVESHDAALLEMVEQIRGRLLAANLLLKLKQVDLPAIDLAQAGQIARSVVASVRAGQLGYALLVGKRHVGQHV